VDGPCEAPFDEDACANGLSCLPIVQEQDTYSNYRCKQECGHDQPCASGNQVCLYPKYARNVKQKAANGRPHVNCTPSLCAKSTSLATDCPCDDERGYLCAQLIKGIDAGVCVKRLGVCGPHPGKDIL